MVSKIEEMHAFMASSFERMEEGSQAPCSSLPCERGRGI